MAQPERERPIKNSPYGTIAGNDLKMGLNDTCQMQNHFFTMIILRARSHYTHFFPGWSLFLAVDKQL